MILRQSFVRVGLVRQKRETDSAFRHIAIVCGSMNSGSRTTFMQRRWSAQPSTAVCETESWPSFGAEAKQLATSTCAAPNNNRTDRDGDHKTNAELVDDVFR
jgi:hypothetical protein